MVFDETYLQDLGIDTEKMSEEQLDEMLKHLYETLIERVGAKISERLSEEQIAAFNELMFAGDQAAMQQWLTENVEDYEEVQEAELQKLEDEIIEQATDINSSHS